MKKQLLLAAPLIALLFFACNKQDGVVSPKDSSLAESSHSNTLSSAPVTLVSSIGRSGGGLYDSYNYETNFTYTGRQLTKAESKMRPREFDVAVGVTTNFYYDTNGQLTNTSIQLSYPQGHPAAPSDIASAKITNAGGHIASIEFFRQDGLSDRKFLIAYSNDKLVQIFDPNYQKTTYEYDEKGNNIKQIVEGYVNGAPTGAVATVVNSSFDSHFNFQKSMPLWVYFRCFHICMSKQGAILNFSVLQGSFTNTPGVNNPLSISTYDADPILNYYEYNASDYPTVICDRKQYLWLYSYITVE
jgi:YD repeat-containing protein